jgi:SAM-dependent methyltransferase
MRKALFERHARLEGRHWWFVARRLIMQQIVDRLCLSSGEVIVDVGCGTGANTASLNVKYSCVGVDPSCSAIALARATYPDVRFLCGLPDAVLPEIKSPISCILLMDVLEHVQNDADLIRSILDHIPSGAFLLVTVPADMRLWSEHDVTFEHYRRYDLDGLRSVFKGVSIRWHLLSYFCTHTYPLVRAIRTLRGAGGISRRTGASDLYMPVKPLNWLLTQVFAAEGNSLVKQFDARNHKPAYSFGSSLITVVEKID